MTDSKAALAAFLAKGGKITKCAAASADDVKESTAAYWHKVRAIESNREPVATMTDEQRAERFVETATQARHAGASVSDALDMAREVTR